MRIARNFLFSIKANVSNSQRLAYICSRGFAISITFNLKSCFKALRKLKLYFRNIKTRISTSRWFSTAIQYF